jgi:hypothetical protein
VVVVVHHITIIFLASFITILVIAKATFKVSLNSLIFFSIVIATYYKGSSI